MTYCYCDYDRPAWVRSSLYHSKRSRRCEECGCRINAGDKYEYTAGKWSGDVSTFSTCINCRDLRVWTVNNVPCACWEYGNVFEGLKFIQIADARIGNTGRMTLTAVLPIQFAGFPTSNPCRSEAA